MVKKIVNIEVGSDIKSYLDDIAEKLWTNHATIMVGAGFSKNASKDFPTWNELGDVFYEKLYGKKPESNQVRYCNVLKLADGVEAAFGRNTLNHILTTNIPNTLVEPVKLHHTLLSLPWVDVFTTNYDTLLEKATEKVNTRRYDVVVNSNELVYSSSPRIIKLHGSFPSSVPFIITEEDYRTYPEDFSPFVNTVQQSLLENTLCLVGFSGDDPNFLKWIGWIRDNLGQNNSPKIYLIGLFNFSNVDVRLLDKRNIVVIDMGSCAGIEKNQHGDALNRFFDYLNSKNNSLSQLNWPRIEQDLIPDRQIKENSISQQIDSFNSVTDKLRKEYPGWLISPHKSRERLYFFVERWLSFLKKEDDISITAKAEFLDNCIWCSNICLTPIFDGFAELVSSFLLKVEEINNNNLSMRLCLSLARYYREEYKWSEWENIVNKVIPTIDVDSYELRDKLYYEVCLSHLYKGNFVELRKSLDGWDIKDTSPQWMLKKSSLFAEVGELEIAVKIAWETLNIIRRKLNLTPITNDVTLLSLESYVMMLLQYELRSDFDFNNPEMDNFSERWNQLRLFQCDPWGELEFLSHSLNYTNEGSVSEVKVPCFDIGSYQTTRNFGSNKYVINSLNLLRFYEDSGQPFIIGNSHLSGDSLRNALAAVSYHYPFWACFSSLRLSTNKAIDTVFTRKGLSITSNIVLNTMAEMYLSILKELDVDSKERKNRARGIHERSAEAIPIILSRLTSNIEFDLIYKIFDFTLSILDKEVFIKYKGILDILERIPKVISKKQSVILFPLAIKCRCPIVVNRIEEQKLIPPIWNLDLGDLDCYSLKPDDFNYFISLMKSKKDHERSWGILSLVKLYDIKVLNDNQKKEFGVNLWDGTKNGELPSWNCLHLTSYLSLPHSQEVNELIEITKKYIFDFDIPIVGDTRSYSQIGRHIPFFTELLNDYKKIDLSLNEIIRLTDELLNWWRLDKIHLNDLDEGLFGSKANEFRSRFSCLIKTLKCVILPRFEVGNISDELLNDVLELISDLKCNDFSITSLYISNNDILNISDDDIFESIIDDLLSNNEGKIIDSCHSLIYWLSVNKSVKQKECIDFFINKILLRSEVGLSSVLKALFVIFRDHADILEPYMINNIVKSIMYVKNETELEINDNELKIAEKLELREDASEFANYLYESESVSGNDKEILSLWIDILKLDSDFNEVKRYWQ